jgi:hypothetical protein
MRDINSPWTEPLLRTIARSPAKAAAATVAIAYSTVTAPRSSLAWMKVRVVNVFMKTCSTRSSRHTPMEPNAVYKHATD